MRLQKSWSWVLLAIGICNGGAAGAQAPLALPDAIALAQQQSVAARLAENIRENRAFHYQTFLASLRPQLGFEAGFPAYSRDFFEVRQPDGGIRFLFRTQNTAHAGFSLFQVIPQTGGQISVNAKLTRFDDFERDFHSFNATPFNIDLQQPLFAFNPFKWSRKIEPLRLEEAQKAYKFQMGEIALRTVQLFFDVLDARESVRIAGLNLENNQKIKEIEERRIALGTTSREKLLQIDLQVLRAAQGLQEANADLQNGYLNFRSFLGMQDKMPLELIAPEIINDFSIDPNLALQQARENRAEYIAFARQRLESDRDVEQARLARNQVTLNATLGFNGAGDRLPEVFNQLAAQQGFSIGLSIPVLDWGRNKAQKGIAAANEKVIAYTIEQQEQDLRTEVTNQVNALQLLRANIHFARQTNAIADERYALALEQYQIGKLPLTDLNIALSERDAARHTYIAALRRYWEALYRLRQMTLYDFERGEKM